MSLVSKFCWFLWHLSVVSKQFTKGTFSKQDNEQNILSPTKVSGMLASLCSDLPRRRNQSKDYYISQSKPLSVACGEIVSPSLWSGLWISFIHSWHLERAGIYKSLLLLRLKQNYVEFAYFPNSLATTVQFTTHPPYFGIRQCFWWVLFNCTF